MLLVILMVKKLLGSFRKKNFKKSQREFRVEKVINRKGDKIYIKWKSYDNSFSSWIDKKHRINE